MKRIFWALCALLAISVVAGAQTTTLVQGPVYNADGSPLNGQATISWPTFSYNGTSIPAGRKTVPIVNGQFNVSLVPTDLSVPPTSYQVYIVSAGTSQPQYWLVPTSATPVKISDISTNYAPAYNTMVNLNQLLGNGATIGQILQWNGSRWLPGSSGAGSVTNTSGPLTSGSLIFGNSSADIKTGDLLGDVTTSGSSTTTVVRVGGSTAANIHTAEQLVNSGAFDAAGAAAAAQASSLQKTSNLSDLSNAATARTNLGLGSAATQPTSAFDAAGAAAAVQSASAQKSANLSDLSNAATARTNLGISTVGHTGAYSDLTGVPTFGTLAPSASVLGTVMYWNGSAWVVLSGNNSGTACLQENSSGTPVWGACGSGGGSPGGGGTAIQVNGGGLFIGDQANFSYNSTTHAMTATGSIYMGPNTPSTILGGFYAVQNITGDSIFYDTFHDESVFNVTTTGGFTSFDSDLLINGATNINHSNAFQDRRRYAGTGSIGTMNGFYHQPVLSGGGAVNNLYPVHIVAPTISNGSTVGNFAAIQIDSAPAVTGSAYNIYAAPNIPSYFGGQVQFGNGGSLGTGTYTGNATFSGNLTFSGAILSTNTSTLNYLNGLTAFGGATTNPLNSTVLLAGCLACTEEIDAGSAQGTSNFLRIRNSTPADLLTFNYNGASILHIIDAPDSTNMVIEAGNGFGVIGMASNTQLIFETNGANVGSFTAAGQFNVPQTSPKTTITPTGIASFTHPAGLGNAPTIASGACGTGTNGTVSTNSTDFAGIITVGAAAASSCALTFNSAFTTAPVCTISSSVALASPTVSTVGATLTIGATALANSTISYVCVGQKGG